MINEFISLRSIDAAEGETESPLTKEMFASRDPQVGIYWGAGTLVHSPEQFIEDAAQMTRDELPLNLWVDFRPQRNPDQTLGIFTTGMASRSATEKPM